MTPLPAPAELIYAIGMAAVAVNADAATRFDQIMALHTPKTPGTFAYIEVVNSDGSLAENCGNGMRCVVQALAAEDYRAS